jgi:hypothetical protein
MKNVLSTSFLIIGLILGGTAAAAAPVAHVPGTADMSKVQATPPFPVPELLKVQATPPFPVPELLLEARAK